MAQTGTASIAKHRTFARRIAAAWKAYDTEKIHVIADWDGPGRHAIVWEEGAPHEWAYHLSGGVEEEFGFRLKAVEAPAGTFAEPHYSFVVSLWKDGV